MNKLKEIVIERINNMNDLKQILSKQSINEITHQKKYQLLLEYKKAQRNRSLRQNEILVSMNSLGFNTVGMYEELYVNSVEICAIYDEKFRMYGEKNQVDINENIRDLYCDFFNTHGFRSKCQYINTLIEKDTNFISPALYFGWLSEWSKKMFCQTLKDQIQQTFQSPDKSFRPNIQHSVHVMTAIENKKKNDQILFLGSATECIYELSFSSRANVYSFFIDDLQTYYKTCGFQGVDYTYLKTIRKRIRKEEFLKPTNLTKAIETLISTTGNKEISNIMKQYGIQYASKIAKQKQKSPNIKATQFPKKMSPLSPIKRRIRNITDGDDSKPQSPPTKSKNLSPKFSQFLFIKPQQIEQKIKKLKIINQRTIRNNIEFPGICKIETCKNDLRQLISNKSFNLATNKQRQRQDLAVPLQKKRKDKKFFRCQSIKVKCKISEDQQALQQSLFKSNFKNSNSFQISSQYDDQNMKFAQAKRFQLSDLRRNIKMAITKRALQISS